MVRPAHGSPADDGLYHPDRLLDAPLPRIRRFVIKHTPNREKGALPASPVRSMSYTAVSVPAARLYPLSVTNGSGSPFCRASFHSQRHHILQILKQLVVIVSLHNLGGPSQRFLQGQSLQITGHLIPVPILNGIHKCDQPPDLRRL